LKIHILTQLKEGPWGGGNQFQVALRNYFRQREVYAEDMKYADVILSNSHHWMESLWKLYRLQHKKEHVILHRIDGPVSVVRDNPKQLLLDKVIFRFNRLIAHGTVFQSNWSRQQCLDLGMHSDKPEVMFLNAPNPTYFYPPVQYSFSKKVNLIATSWSDNWRKGFDIYKYLDEHLDFAQYSLTFVGNSPISFSNIKILPPLPSQKLAEELRKHDLFLTASVDDPCSNSLIEGMHCGLPAVARNSGGHPEIVRQGGVLFDGQVDVLEKIDYAAQNLEGLRDKIQLPNINEVGEAYLCFAKELFLQQQHNALYTKAISLSKLLQLYWEVWKYRLQ